MKIRTKLLAGFLSVAFLCGAMGLFGILQMTGLKGSLSNLAGESIATLDALGEVKSNMYALKSAVRSIANPMGIDDDDYYKRQIDNIATFRDAYNKAVADFESTSPVPEEARLWKAFKDQMGAAKAYNDGIVALVDQARALKAQYAIQARLATSGGPSAVPGYGPQAAAAGTQAAAALASARSAIYDQIYADISGDKRLIYDNMLSALAAVVEYDHKHYAVDLPAAEISAAEASISLMIVIAIVIVGLAAAVGIIFGASMSRSIRRIADKVGKIAVGDLSQKLEIASKDELGELSGSVNGCIDAILGLVQDMNRMSREHDAGDIDVRIDSEKFQGSYKAMAEGINTMVFGHIAVKKKAMACISEFSKGNFDAPLETFPGKKVFINENIELLRANLKALVLDANMLSRAAVEGKLATRAEASKHQGDYRRIVEGVNDTLDAVIGPLNVAATYVDSIAKGEIPPRITDSYNGDFNLIKNNLNTCIDALQGLIQDMSRMSREHDAGDIDVRIDADRFQGSYKAMAEGINTMVFGHIAVKKKAMACIAEFSRGNFDAPLERFPGKKVFINDNIELLRANLKALVTDANMLVEAATEGRLATRAEAAKHQGDYRKIVDGVNRTLDLVIAPVNETISVLKHLADGDLTVLMAGDYKGDFDVLKGALNASLDSINEILSQVSVAVDQVTAGSQQVSQASQSLSQGATEQASSLEEITSSITEVSSQTKLNTENAIQVNGLAKTARDNAEQGNGQMKDLVAAMTDINKSAEEIRKIVKAIDDISFQINLLALNANVEAARAGKYGKGFAVVAEEVRNLAVRSANSVKDTTRMVDEAIANIERGNGLVDVTAKQLDSIVDGAAKVATLAEDVATASKEQALGLEQVTSGLNQIDQVTQANTASAEQSASAAEELSSQSQQLKVMVSRFKLKAGDAKRVNAEVLEMLRDELARQSAGKGPAIIEPRGRGQQARPQRKQAAAAELISLDDGDFGKF